MDNGSDETVITIIHFNDCYNIEPSSVEPVGGAARFKTAVNSLIEEDNDGLVLFSGDILSPSIMSTYTKGEHMIPVLNQCRVECAVFGNHDFDFGVEKLIEIANQTKFPWLMSNVIDNETNRPLAEGLTTHIIERKGKKFGLIGLVEEEWLDTLATLDRDDITYLDFVTEGRKLARYLREKQNVDYVIALTHMRTPNDCHLAENVDEIDLILGGHDHVYEIKKVNNKFIIKSGSEFRQLSKIKLTFNYKNGLNLDEPINENSNVKEDLAVNVAIEKIDITTKYKEDEQLKKDLEQYSSLISHRLQDVLGHFACDLDGRFSSIRTQETNLGNFVTDIMLSSTHSDLAILNSGTFRSDKIHPKGEFKLKDLVDIFPDSDGDQMIVISITGKQILEALENGVSQWPRLEGRFPQVSGIRFAFDPRKPSGQRVNPKYIRIADEYLDLNQYYRLVTQVFIYKGKDGYQVFKNCPVLVSEEQFPIFNVSIQNHFEAIKILMNPEKYYTHHRQSLICLSHRHSSVKMNEISHQLATTAISTAITGNVNNSIDIPTVPSNCDYHKLKETMITRPMKRGASMDDIELKQCKLEPKVEGRIIIINDDQIEQRLEDEYKEYYENTSKPELIPEEPEDKV